MRYRIMAAWGTLLLAAACGKEETSPIQPPALRPGSVLARVASIAIHPERSAPATVIGRNEARLSAEVTAVIRALPADTGQTVQRGAVVARLEPRDAELALERAEAARAQAAARNAQAQVQLDRARTLREKNFYSAEALTLRETELAAAAADLRAATAQRETTRRNLDKHVLRAPFAGIVRVRSGQVGELATPGMVLLTLVETGGLELAAQVQPQDADSLAETAETVFVANGQRHAVADPRISPALNRESRSVEVRLRFTDLPPAPGTAGRLVWQTADNYLPADLLIRRAGRYGVFVESAGKARFHVLPEAQEGRPALLDLPPETQIVTEGRHALQDGMPLQ